MLSKILILTLISSCLGYLTIYPPEIARSITHPSNCWYMRENLLIRNRQSKFLRGCEEIRCNEDYSMTLVGCGVIALDSNQPNCRIVRDLFKNYPECCEKIVCDNAEKMHQVKKIN